jgi:hypothetical protein
MAGPGRNLELAEFAVDLGGQLTKDAERHLPARQCGPRCFLLNP